MFGLSLKLEAYQDVDMSHSIGDASIQDALELFGPQPEIEPTLLVSERMEILGPWHLSLR